MKKIAFFDTKKYDIESFDRNNKNYEIEFTSANFVIEKRTLNVVADAISCVYGEQEQPLTYQLSNVAYNDKFDLCLYREQGDNVGEYFERFVLRPLRNLMHGTSDRDYEFSVEDTEDGDEE